MHEAGHLATLPHHIRCGLDGQLPDIDMHRGAELMSLAWSYAAAVYLKVPPHVVFHEHGYKGGSQELIANFEKGISIGLPMLQYQEMAYDEENAERLKVRPFPDMVNWTCLKQHLP
ncbi:hypothetical protein [Pedobacter sp. ok626]|uniref:hypothetical protein n=1 Tax=Pedobacter sp. ok626 TaxID=1761882 RepID=UPI000B876F6C|nr:hypothetical protein [Pedobacter sp. ok626]